MTDTTSKPRDLTVALFRDSDRMTPNDGLTLTFSNGATLQLQLADLDDNIIAHAVLHGLKQKLVDAAAISRDPDTGRTATIDTKYAAVRDVYDRLCAGEWNKRREGGTTGGLLLRALAILYPQRTKEQLVEFLAGKSEAEKAALRRNPKLVPIIDDLRAQDGRDSGIDSDDLLDSLAD